jgi:hypothetical protein
MIRLRKAELFRKRSREFLEPDRRRAELSGVPGGEFLPLTAKDLANSLTHS